MHGAPDVRVPCAIEEGDLDFATLHRTCMYVRERFEVLFGRPASPITIQVGDTTAVTADVRGGRVIYRQPSMAAMSRGRTSALPGDEGILSREPATLLDHELGHMLLVAESGLDPEGYGTPLPDWADEAVAVWSESEEQRAEWARAAAALDDVTLDLVAFSALEHPTVGKPRFQHREVSTRVFRCHVESCEGLRSIARDTFRIIHLIDVNGVSTVDTVFPEDSAFQTLDMTTYYAVASTILRFFHARGGPALVNTLFERMRAGRTGAGTFSNLPRLPPDAEAVNREWRAFVRAGADSARSP